MNVDLWLDCQASVGESPTWLGAANAIYWIDVKEPALHCIGAGGVHSHWNVESDIGAFALLEDRAAALVALAEHFMTMMPSEPELGSVLKNSARELISTLLPGR